MIDKRIASPCGLFCGDCSFFNDTCKGCGHVQGRPFWTSEMDSKICPIYDCCINRKHLDHCGLCPQLPCKIFLELRDPALSDEEFHISLRNRQRELEKRKEMGTERWLETKSRS